MNAPKTSLSSPWTTLLSFVRAYLRTDFQPGLYAAAGLLVTGLLILNYTVRLENGIIDADPANPWRPVWYFLLYSTAYYGTTWLWTVFHKQPSLWRDRQFWLQSGVGLAAYSWYAGFYGYAQPASQLYDGQIYWYAFKVLSNLQSLLTIVLPLWVCYRLTRPEPNGFYGLRPTRKGWEIYAILLLVMVAIIGLASFQPDFIAYYPTYRDTLADEFFGVPAWVTALGYELAYGWDFIPTELFFRGFLVIGISRFFRGPVLPMAVCYVTIHFGKPPGEAVSSLLGGYLLGVLALYTRSIWGGVVVHLGVAWLMEGAAFLQRLRS